jgi:SpoVK/Ycf46/Vps4 family AAA+-type ATPase
MLLAVPRGANFFQVPLPSLLESKPYDPDQVLVALFAMAQKMAPSIIWMDQPEVLQRVGLTSETERRVLVTLLMLLENLNQKNIFVLFTTTRYLFLLAI